MSDKLLCYGPLKVNSQSKNHQISGTGSGVRSRPKPSYFSERSHQGLQLWYRHLSRISLNNEISGPPKWQFWKSWPRSQKPVRNRLQRVPEASQHTKICSQKTGNFFLGGVPCQHFAIRRKGTKLRPRWESPYACLKIENIFLTKNCRLRLVQFYRAKNN